MAEELTEGLPADLHMQDTAVRDPDEDATWKQNSQKGST